MVSKTNSKINSKTIRRKKTKQKTKPKQDKYKLIKQALKNFKKPIHLIRHLHTTSNIVRSLVPDTLLDKHFKNKYKGGFLDNLKKYIPTVTKYQGEPVISYKGEKEAIGLFKKYNISKTNDNKYTIFVTPYIRTWITTILCLRDLTKNKGFELTLIVTNISGIHPSSITGRPTMRSINYMKTIFRDNEKINVKFCTDIKKNYTCKLVDIVDVVEPGKKNSSISYEDFYIKLTKEKFYSKKGGFNIFEVFLMVSKSCRQEYKDLDKIIFIGHSGVIFKNLHMIDIPDLKLTNINGYLILFTLKHKKINIKIILPNGKQKFDLNV